MVLLLGEAVDLADPLQGLGGSAYLQVIQNLKTGSPPRCGLDQAKKLHETLLELIRAGLVKSAHDCSEGGLLVAIAESCISRNDGRGTPALLGAEIDLSKVEGGARLDALLFGETQSRVVISVSHEAVDLVLKRAYSKGVAAAAIGRVGGGHLRLTSKQGCWAWDLGALHDGWWNSIARAMR